MSENAIIYCRVSTKAQTTRGHGLGSQETRCRQYAETKGYDVAAVFPDDVSGGGDFMKRPKAAPATASPSNAMCWKASSMTCSHRSSRLRRPMRC